MGAPRRPGESDARAALRAFLVLLPLGAIGTVTHELGHAAVAAFVGVPFRVHYAWVSTDGIVAGSAADLAFVLGGPVQTVLTGTLGLVGLVALRRRVPDDAPLGVAGWTAAALALFWSREPAILAEEIGARLAGVPGLGDENEIALFLGWPTWTVPAALGVLGLAVCLAVVRLAPRGQRLAFMLGGGAGAVVGGALWLLGIGPIVLP